MSVCYHKLPVCTGSEVDLGSFLDADTAVRLMALIELRPATVLVGAGLRIQHVDVLLDPKELGIVEVKQPLHFHKNPADAPEILHTVNKQIQSADGFFVVAAEYNSQIAPALSSLMDNFPTASYSYRPSAIVTYSVGKQIHSPIFGDIRPCDISFRRRQWWDQSSHANASISFGATNGSHAQHDW